MLTSPKYLGDKVDIGFRLTSNINMEETFKWIDSSGMYFLLIFFQLFHFSPSSFPCLADIMARHSEATLWG